MTDSHWIFADGACSGNPGPGGYGSIVITREGEVFELGGGESATTNNRMELQAVIEAFALIRARAGNLRVFTDSVYVIRGITAWIFGWQKNGWKTAEGNEVSNREYWQALLEEVRARKSLGSISWEFVKGHAGIVGNERCDEIAVCFSKGDFVSLYRGSEGAYGLDIRNIPSDTSVPESKDRSKVKTASAAGYPIYLSLVAGSLSRDHDWPSCEKRVKGVSGTKFKKVNSPAEEEQILKSWGKL